MAASVGIPSLGRKGFLIQQDGGEVATAYLEPVDGSNLQLVPPSQRHEADALKLTLPDGSTWFLTDESLHDMSRMVQAHRDWKREG